MILSGYPFGLSFLVIFAGDPICRSRLANLSGESFLVILSFLVTFSGEPFWRAFMAILSGDPFWAILPGDSLRLPYLVILSGYLFGYLVWRSCLVILSGDLAWRS